MSEDGDNQGGELDEQHDQLRAMIENVIEVRRVAMLEEIEQTISARIETKIESAMANLLTQLRISQNNDGQQNINAQPQGQNVNTQPDRIQIESQLPRHSQNHADESPITAFNQQVDSIHFSGGSQGLNSSRIEQMISSWNIKFDGTSKLSVDNFIARLECQVTDTLGGNYNSICEHILNVWKLLIVWKLFLIVSKLRSGYYAQTGTLPRCH